MKKQEFEVRNKVGQRDLHLSWRLPAALVEDKKLNMRRKRQNRFLKFMELKLIRLIEQDERRAWKFFERLSRQSICFNTYILYKANKGFYHKWTEEEAKGYINSQYGWIKRKHFSLKMRRNYIKKPNGKLRPIGSPSAPSKGVYVTVLSFLEKWIKLGDYQHGFRQGRGTYTTSMEVIRNLRNGKKVYEFDLSAFFNNVHAELTGREIRKSIWDLGNWIRYCTRWTFPTFERWDPSDKEIFKTQMKEQGYEKWLRSGFTQGANWSPILSAYVLDKAGYNKIEGLLMYADDGLIFRDEESDDIELNSRKWGVKVATDKSNGWVKDRFTFLGLEYDLKNETVRFNDKEGSWYDEERVREIAKYASYETSEVEGKALHYGGTWAWRAKDESLTVRYASGKGRWIVGETGVLETNDKTFTTLLSFKVMEWFANCNYRVNPTHHKQVSPKPEVRKESEKLFGMSSLIRGKMVSENLAE